MAVLSTLPSWLIPSKHILLSPQPSASGSLTHCPRHGSSRLGIVATHNKNVIKIITTHIRVPSSPLPRRRHRLVGMFSAACRIIIICVICFIFIIISHKLESRRHFQHCVGLPTFQHWRTEQSDKKYHLIAITNHNSWSAIMMALSSRPRAWN